MNHAGTPDSEPFLKKRKRRNKMIKNNNLKIHETSFVIPLA